MSSPPTATIAKSRFKKRRSPAPMIAALASAPLFVVLLLMPLVQRLEWITQDWRLGMRYALHRKMAGIARFIRGERGRTRTVTARCCRDVALIGIDGPTLAKLGKYGSGPWVFRDPFRRLAPIFEFAFPPTVASFDILFRPVIPLEGDRDPYEAAADPDRIRTVVDALTQYVREGATVLENQVLMEMTRIAAVQGDANLAAAFAELSDPVAEDALRPVPVILAYDFKGLDAPTVRRWSRADVLGRDPDDPSVENGESIPYLLDVAIPRSQVHNVPKGYRFLPFAALCTPLLRDCARHAFINVPRDADGIIRRVPLVLGFVYVNPLTGRVHREFVPSFALLSVLLHWGLGPDAVTVDFGRCLTIRRKDGGIRRIPIDREGRMYLNFIGRISDYPNVSLYPFLVTGEAYMAARRRGEELPEHIRKQVDFVRSTVQDRIVMVGLTATGSTDIGPCPLDTHTPYVHVHMTAADNILTGRFLREAGTSTQVLILIGACIVMGAAGAAWHVSRFTRFVLALGAGYSILSQALVEADVMMLPVILPGLYGVLTYCSVVVYRYFTEERERKAVRQMFSTMVSPQVLEYLEENPESFSLTGHRAEVTVMFSDIAGFTGISEKLAPEDLTRLLNEYLSVMTDIIMEHAGYVDKYEGDAIMAEWGVPYPNPDHARAACIAVIEQQEALHRLRPQLEARYGVQLDMRIGLNSGPVAAGNMGSGRRFQYTVMGDTVNQAARFEPANKEYGTRIMAGETTRRSAGDAADFRLLDRLLVVGKTTPVEVYEVLGRAGKTPPDKLDAARWYEEALRAHWERDWDRALELLEKALAACPGDAPSQMLVLRIRNYKEAPPPEDWQGEFVRTTKG